MALSPKACTNILRLLHTQDSRNGDLALRLLNSQQATPDFLLCLCAHFLTSRNEQRLFLRNCLRTFIRLIAVERSLGSAKVNQLMWLLNYDPAQNKESLEHHLALLKDSLDIDAFLLARFIFSRTGQCGGLVLNSSQPEEKLAILECRTYWGAFGNTLDLSRLGIKELPAEILQMNGLTAISLKHNKLKSLPAWLSKYSGLRHIDLSDNDFETVPQALCQLSSLELADLRNNPCQMAYLDFFRHPLRGKLRIGLYNSRGFTLCQFHEEDIFLALQNWVYDTADRQALDLSGLGLRSVPRCLQVFSQLGVLDLRNNAIGQLPTWLLKIPGLHQVYCDRETYYNPASSHEALEVLRDREAKLPPAINNHPARHFYTPQLPVQLPIEFDLSNVLATP